MKLKHILAIAVLITQSIVAQNTKVKDKATNIILKVGVARGFRFSPTPPARSLELAQIWQKVQPTILAYTIVLIIMLH